MSREKRNKTKNPLSEALSGRWVLTSIGQKPIQDG